jgi:CRP-like cAMP-binding protein
MRRDEIPPFIEFPFAIAAAGQIALILPHLRTVDFPQETVLFETDDEIRAVYFPHHGLVWLLVDLASGEMIEAAVIGRDSLAGGSSAFDNKVALNRAVIQVAAAASVLDVDRFREFTRQDDTFREVVARHEQFILAQVQQSAACNAVHALEARLSRWLLQCHNFLGSDDIALTQEFLSDMLGVRRTSVSIVAHTLQTAGLIRYHRGHIRIVNLPGLEESACECYATVQTHAERAAKATRRWLIAIRTEFCCHVRNLTEPYRFL